MNNRVNYTFVGVMVLMGVAMMVAAAYWMLKPSVQEQTKVYAIDFDESVLGLNIDAPVKYRGISVGKVSSIGINETNAEQVRVIIKILKTTPIKEDTVAKLTPQGITGLTYINLSLGSNTAPVLLKKANERYPVIRTAPSFFTNFEQSLSSVSSQLSSTLGKTEELLGRENQMQLTRLLQRTANVMEKMDKLLDDKTIGHLQKSAENMESFTQKLDQLVPKVEQFVDRSILWEENIQKSFSSIMQSYLGIKSSMNEVKRAVASGEFNIKEISADILPTLNATLQETQQLLIRINTTLDEHEKSPSDLFFKSRETQKAPGE